MFMERPFCPGDQKVCLSMTDAVDIGASATTLSDVGFPILSPDLLPFDPRIFYHFDEAVFFSDSASLDSCSALSEEEVPLNDFTLKERLMGEMVPNEVIENHDLEPIAEGYVDLGPPPEPGPLAMARQRDGWG
jgi:hypothetical protein